MQIIKFEFLKKRAIDAADYEFYKMQNGIRNDMRMAVIKNMLDNSVSQEQTMNEWWERVKKVINSWDIRCAAGLIKAFPDILPKKYHNAKFTVAQLDNENSDWVLIWGD